MPLNSQPKDEWIGKTIEERLFYMEHMISILYPDYMAALAEIKRRKIRSEISKKSTGLFCCVSSGGGKTHLTKVLHRLWPPDHSGEISKVPFISFTVPSSPTENTMAGALLKAIGDPSWNQGSEENKYSRAIDLIYKCSVRVICIDNIQDISERRRNSGITRIGSWIRKLFDDANCLILLLGTPEATRVIQDNIQINRRFKVKRTIKKFSIDRPSEYFVFSTFLMKLDEGLPLAETSDFSNERLIKMIYFATNGIIDYIIQLMNEAIENAVIENRENLTLEDFQIGFRNIYPELPKKLNPFFEGGSFRPLTRDGEPYNGRL